jgi:vitamin B12 transporter
LRTTILLIIFFCCPSLYSFAETEDQEIEEIVVTATRWEEPLGQVSDRISTIDKEEIAKHAMRDAAEALDLIPGLIMDRTGGPGSIVFPSVQGAEFYQTAVLINGIPFNDLANGIGNLGQIPSELIERIEIVHGAGGVEWGSALGGVINVITLQPDIKGRSSVLAGGGDYSTRFAAVKLLHSTDAVGLAAGGSLRRGDGPEGDKRSHGSENLVGNLELDIGQNALISVLVYNFNGAAGSGEFQSSLAGYWENYKYQTSGGGTSLFAGLGPGNIKVTGYYQGQTQTTDQNIEGLGQIDSIRLEDRIYGGSAIWRAEFNTSALTFGMEGKNGELKSTSLIADSYKVNTNGAFINLQYRFGNLVLQGGVRHSNEDYFDSFTGFNVGGVYRAKNLPIEYRASASRGYTAPPLSFRFLEITGFFAPNPDLELEKVMGYQAGVKGFLGYGLAFDLNGFYADVTDAISIDQNAQGLSYFRNFEKFLRRGIEAEVSWSSDEGISLFANTLQQEIRDANKDEVVQDKVRASYSLGAGYEQNGWSTSFTGIYRDWNATDKDKVKDREWLWNAKTAYTHQMGERSLQIAVSVYNLTNVELATNELLPLTPPRQIEASLEYLF